MSLSNLSFPVYPTPSAPICLSKTSFFSRDLQKEAIASEDFGIVYHQSGGVAPQSPTAKRLFKRRLPLFEESIRFAEERHELSMETQATCRPVKRSLLNDSWDEFQDPDVDLDSDSGLALLLELDGTEQIFTGDFPGGVLVLLNQMQAMR